MSDPRVREGIKEIAQMDGAIIVSADGTVEATCRYLDCSAADVTLSKGLGARHWAAAAISRATNAVAVTVSQSNGTVRIFQNGETVLRIEPYLRAPWSGRVSNTRPQPPRASPPSPRPTAEKSTSEEASPIFVERKLKLSPIASTPPAVATPAKRRIADAARSL